jgi:hypothetical protein
MDEGGMRWLTVGAKDRPGLELTLMVPGPPALDPESAEQLKALVAKGVLGAGVFTTDDIHADYEAMKARGVEFLQEPKERPYGVEAIFPASDDAAAITDTRVNATAGMFPS